MLVTRPKMRDRAVGIEVSVGGVTHTVQFTKRTLEGTGEVAMVAEVPEGPVLDCFRRNAAFKVWGGALPVDPPAAVVPLPPALAREEPVLPNVVQRTLLNGWDYDDITDTGEQNDWSRAGGVSRLSGLCMSEMSLCSPPVGWKEKRATHYPWEFPGWLPPFAAWEKPAGLRAKRPPADQPPPIDEAPMVLPPGRVFESDAAEAALSTMLATVDEPPRAPRAPASTQLAIPTNEALAGWSDQNIASAVGLLVDVKVQDGKWPALGKARSRLNKAGIFDNVSTAQADALLARAQTLHPS